MADQGNSIALVFLARGAEANWRQSFARFVDSYRNHPTGIDHRLYVIFKGFRTKEELEAASGSFAGLDYSPIHLGDDSFDIGAYLEIATRIREYSVCFLNTHSEILDAGWLAKMAAVLRQPKVGVVGASGSYESLARDNAAFPEFPNVHLRLNAFMLPRESFLAMGKGQKIGDKWAARLFESGPASLSRQILVRGQHLMVVGRNGVGYAHDKWPTSDTFRESAQENLLIGDNQTRFYEAQSWKARQAIAQATWGVYLLMNLPEEK